MDGIVDTSPAFGKAFYSGTTEGNGRKELSLASGIKCWQLLSGHYARFNRTFVDVPRLQLRLSELVDTIGTGDYDVLVLTVLLLEDPEHPILADN